MIPVTLPQLSISMEEGTVLRWLVADGARVRAGQRIVEIETDKATMEIEAPAEGTIRIVAVEGAVLAVDSTLAEVVEGAEEDPAASSVSPRPAAESGLSAPAPLSSEVPDGLRQIASPAARRIARERGIDLAAVRGSGPGGRITMSDLTETALSGLPAAAPAAAPARRELREAIVANIIASWREIPHIHIGSELDGTGLAEAKRGAPKGVTVTDLLIVAVAGALAEVPEINGRLGHPSERVNLALAVATSSGVVAPVLRDVARLPLERVADERQRLVEAARAGRLDGRDQAEGTFTLSNLGMYPVDFFVPVVSGPQIAMLATGRLTEKAVAIDGMIAIRHRLCANVAIDHRGADGDSGARFLSALERHLRELPTTI